MGIGKLNGKFVLAVIFGIILASTLPSSFSTHPSIEGATKMIVLGPEDFVSPNLGGIFPEKLNSLTNSLATISAAPVDIPDGATITGIECRVTDNSGDESQGVDISCSLVQVAHSDGTSTEIIKLETTDAPGTITLFDMTLHHLVDRDANHYGIVYTAIGCLGECQLHSVKIIYTIPTPLQDQIDALNLALETVQDDLAIQIIGAFTSIDALTQGIGTLLSVMGTINDAVVLAYELIATEIGARTAGDAALQTQADNLQTQIDNIQDPNIVLIPIGSTDGFLQFSGPSVLYFGNELCGIFASSERSMYIQFATDTLVKHGIPDCNSPSTDLDLQGDIDANFKVGDILVVDWIPDEPQRWIEVYREQTP